MGDHLTLRVPSGTTRRLERRARMTGAPPRTLAARYVEEGIRRDDHPLVHFVDGETGRRAALIGTHLDVWEAIATVRDNDNHVRAAAEYLGISVGSVDAAVAYYGEFATEIDGEIALNEAESERGLDAWRKGRQALSR
jgi:hypothetical protein